MVTDANTTELVVRKSQDIARKKFMSLSIQERTENLRGDFSGSPHLVFFFHLNNRHQIQEKRE